MRKLFYKIENFFAWIVKAIQYSWFLRKDFDWDYGFLLKLMRFKLARMAKTIKTNEIIEDHERVAKQIDYAVYLIDRYHSDEDLEREMVGHKAKWGEPKSFFTSYETVSGIKCSRLITEYPNAKTPEENEKAIKDAAEAYMRIERKEKELLDRLFKHMSKYLRGWWD